MEEIKKKKKKKKKKKHWQRKKVERLFQFRSSYREVLWQRDKTQCVVHQNVFFEILKQIKGGLKVQKKQWESTKKKKKKIRCGLFSRAVSSPLAAVKRNHTTVKLLIHVSIEILQR